MALTPGSFVGSYEITGLLGVGGMGEVYSARDSKLERRVAIKVLPPDVAENPERRQRFEREARLLAALNHPNIAVIHGLEHDGAAAAQSTSALVMELVEGPTLADRLTRGALPLDEALPIAKQIAEALEAAHEQGIVHRDLKPANIKLRPDGGVKVLDFGLAKALTPDPSAPTARATLTSLAQSRPGFVLGTPAYMPPEQARGASVDESADLWSFGCVLYETLTGAQAFAGEDTTDIIAAVVRGEPDWSKLPTGTPLLVRLLLKQCLRKQPRQRLADARAARLMLEEAIAAPVSAEAPARAEPGRVRWTLLAGIVAVLAALGGWLLGPAPPAPDRVVTHALLGVEPAAQLAPGFAAVRQSRRMMTLSPDGRTLVFAAYPQPDRGPPVLYRRSLDAVDAVPLLGEDNTINIVPFFSPDGAWLAFWGVRDGVLRKVPIAGGPSEVIAQLPPGTGSTVPWGESWGTDGTIVFSAGSYADGEGIFRVSANGSTPERITTIDAAASEKRHVLPHLLPGDRTLLYTAEIDTGGAPDTVIVALLLDTGERRVLLERAADARYVPSGHLLFMRSGTLMAAGFDPTRVELTTAPVAMLADVAQSIGASNWNDESYEGQFVVANGTLLYLTGGLYSLRQSKIIAVERDGTQTTLHGNAGEVWAPRLAPDGQRLAFVKRTRQMFGHADIWIYDLERATERPVTFDGRSVWPAWSPDGRELLFRGDRPSDQTQLFRVPGDGSRAPTPIGSAKHQGATAAWSTTLDSIAFVTNDAGIRRIWVQPMAGAAEPNLATEVPYEVMDPMLSPDGRWLAYVSLETGSQEIYVQPYGVPGEKVRISNEGGIGPIWAPDGRELFYITNTPERGVTRMMAVDVDFTAGFRAGRPRQLFAGTFEHTMPLRNYDYDAANRRFIMIKTIGIAPPPVTQMHVIFNWLDELERRVPAVR